MSSNLTPEERQRIVEEQRLRNEETLRTGMQLWLKMLLIFGGIVLFIMLCSLVFGAAAISSILGPIFDSMYLLNKAG